jgi:hypothetical protein
MRPATSPIAHDGIPSTVVESNRMPYPPCCADRAPSDHHFLRVDRRGRVAWNAGVEVRQAAEGRITAPTPPAREPLAVTDRRVKGSDDEFRFLQPVRARIVRRRRASMNAATAKNAVPIATVRGDGHVKATSTNCP